MARPIEYLSTGRADLNLDYFQIHLSIERNGKDWWKEDARAKLTVATVVVIVVVDVIVDVYVGRREQ